MSKVATNQIVKIPMILKIKRKVLNFINQELSASDLDKTVSAVVTASMEALMRDVDINRCSKKGAMKEIMR